MKIPDAKAAAEKERKKLEIIPAWQLAKVRNKNEVIAEARHKGKTVNIASLMDLCQYSRTNDYVKLWLRHCVQLYAQQHHA